MIKHLFALLHSQPPVGTYDPGFSTPTPVLVGTVMYGRSRRRAAHAFDKSDTRGPEETVAVITQGDVSDHDIQYALRHIGALVEKVKEPVLFARVKLTLAPDPARPRPAIAQALLDINGNLIRAHVAAETIPSSIQLLQDRLSDKLDHRAKRRRDLRKRPGVSEPGEWRHGDLPTARPDYYDRPGEERRLVRRKSFEIEELTPDEAALDMEQLDHDFYLFRDLDSGEDAVIERQPDGSYRLTRLHPATADLGPTSEAVVVSDYPPPELAVDEAIERLEAIGQRFLFFADTTTGRGNVVYHRYDGHYGMITPA